uniref:Endoplasmin-like n=1 Tax=Sinocyclocheilus grahami TaxID=75366 RepID=A0A672NPT3_SINGR
MKCTALCSLMPMNLTKLLTSVKADDDDDVDIDGTVEEDLGKSRDGSRTDDEIVQREEEAIQLDGLNASQIKEIREKAEKHAFQAEVNRMMKLIINSLYKNKEIFLRELISNASDALDKIRLLSLTNEDALAGNEELTIKIKSDKEKNMLHITDTGIGMTKEELVKNLGTIAKSGTSEFLNKMTDMQEEGQSTSELIGQFGVGFYSAFLVADKVIVTSKHNNDTQHIWESDSNDFSVINDPRGDTLGRGTTITLVMKEEASDYLELETIKNLVRKYSQFINFPIYVWSSKTETVEEPIEEEEEAEKEEAAEDEAEVEEEDEDKDKPKTKKVEKTVWDWELMNDIKPIWQRPAKEVEEDEYKAFYKTFSRDSDEPISHIHFTAEGEVTFKSILFIPASAPRGLFDEYGTKKNDFIKLFVRRVFITDDFHDMMPKYLNFIKGVVSPSVCLFLSVASKIFRSHKDEQNEEPTVDWQRERERERETNH